MTAAGPGVELIVTGFGSFHDVPENPTSRLVSWIADEYGAPSAAAAAAPPPSRALRHGRVQSCTVLKVSAQAVSAFLASRLEELRARAAAACALSSGACAPPPVVLLLHFGVDVHRPWFNLETRAVNNATFRAPDEDGWQPKACPIAAAPGRALGAAVATALDLRGVRRALRAAGHDVRLSADAGKFVCNFCYYRSLELCREVGGSSGGGSSSGGSSSGGSGSCSDCSGGAAEEAAAAAAEPAAGGVGGGGGGGDGGAPPIVLHSLFVHVPSFKAVPEAAQRRFAADLLEALTRQLARAHLCAPGVADPAAAAPLPPPPSQQQQHNHHKQQQQAPSQPHSAGGSGGSGDRRRRHARGPQQHPQHH